MRTFWYGMFVLLMLGTAIGCDSGGNDENTDTPDAEVFIGNWRLTQLLLTNQEGTQDATFLITAAGITVDVDFESSTFVIDVNMADSTTSFAGAYSVNETQQSLILTSSDFTAPVSIQYVINSENQIRLVTDDVALFSDLTGFDTTLLGQIDSITLVVQRIG